MTFAKRLGSISASEMRWLTDKLETVEWRHRHLPDRDFYTASIFDFWEPCDRAFFLKIKPGGMVHRHTDPLINGETHHFVVSTNPECENFWHDGADHSMHMKQATRYAVDRKREHWASNQGTSDRVHLIVEYDEKNPPRVR